MELPEIEDFETFLIKVLPVNKTYLKSTKSQLNAAGDNYASIILAIDIDLKNEDGEEETLHTVAKLPPPNEFMKKFMNVPYTIRNELGFYQTMVPTLRNFQKEQQSSKSLQFIPDFYGGRLNIDPCSEILDENSLIVMENLKASGYFLFDKNAGFDLEVSKLILSHMAELHAAVIALKETQPETFQEKILPFFDEFRIFQMDNNEEFMTSPVVVDAILKIVEQDELCALYIQKIRQTVKACVENLSLPKNAQKFRDDVFASLIHDDLWVNNIMVKTKMGKIVDVKFVDWQLYEYGSVGRDIMFFLCSSAQDIVFKDHFDDVIKFYYNSLIDNLKELKCDTEKFGFDVFLKELKKEVGQIAYAYVMGAIPSIFASGDQVFEVDELSKEKLLGQAVNVSDVCRGRICLITRKFIQKGWI